VDYTKPESISPEVKAAIMSDTHKYRLLIFRNNGEHMSGDAQVEISQWFGKIDNTFYKHATSPNTNVFRVSNDPKEGSKGVGRAGWHIDGTFKQKPFKV
jgi:taurine dioxygenase